MTLIKCCKITKMRVVHLTKNDKMVVKINEWSLVGDKGAIFLSE